MGTLGPFDFEEYEKRIKELSESGIFDVCRIGESIMHRQLYRMSAGTGKKKQCF